jgi:hypothetical protein
MKPCGHCQTAFEPVRPLQAVCSPLCASRLVRAKKAREKLALKEEKAKDRATRERLETIPSLRKKAQQVFNKWVRARDEDQPCISCGKPPGDLTQLHAGRDAGHYRSTGSAPHMRFYEDNCHAQCVLCNQWGAGRAVDYRIGLAARIGMARVESLEADNTPRHFTKDDLKAIRATYQAKLKQLKERA